MTDRRLLRANGRVAHVSLKGQVEAERFVEGKTMRVAIQATDLLSAPDGSRDRQMVMGEAFRVLQPTPNYFSFGFAERDGYCGYVRHSHLWDAPAPTHRVAARQTYFKQTADLKSSDPVQPLHFGSLLTVVEEHGIWSRLMTSTNAITAFAELEIFVPSPHLVPFETRESDVVAVARRFLGTPYVWGGNSSFGIDCSGLIQAAMLACGRACPGDSDLQQAMPGEHLPEDATLEPGDLIHWDGHVAMATGPETLIHANAHHMMVVEEPMAEATKRIATTDTGPVTLRLRPVRRPLSG